MNELEILSRQLAREKMARKEAESIAETKSRILYQKNLDLQSLSNDLIDKEKNTRAILEATADGIIVMNDNYDVVLCNQASCQLFHYDSEELTGKNIKELINFIEPNQSDEAITTFFESRAEHNLYEFNALRKDKTIIPVELSLSKIRLTLSLSIILVIRNIFLRKQLEQRIAVQQQITRLMAEASSLDEIAPKILQIVCETLKLQESGLWKVDPVSKILRCVDTWGIDDKKIHEFAEVSKKMTFAEGLGLPGRVWQNKEIAWIEDISKEKNFPRNAIANKAGLHSAFAFPILFEGEVLAVIEFFMDKLYPFEKELIQLIQDITNQIGVFINLEQAQKQVATLSRLSGMSQVASSVLHNVGNTLNSINVSIDTMDSKVNGSKVASLAMLSNLLKEHTNDFVSFIQNDPKGQNLVEFLSLISATLDNEKRYLLNELTQLKNNIAHVKQIIDMQQALSNAGELAEAVHPNELIENSLVVHRLAIEQADIKITFDFKSIKKARTSKAKLLQIIINLVKNAIDALVESSNSEKHLKLTIQDQDQSHFIIEIADNGVGMMPNHLTKIFSVGYTTKTFGHGYGLHTSAVFAKELGGHLSANSKGIGQGATFTLMLPYQNDF